MPPVAPPTVPSVSLNRLPPLSALRTFLVAARHLSFVQAANELNVTPAAVGQQVRLLEACLGRALFTRNNRSLALTDDGRMILPGLAEGFERIVGAVTLLQGAAAAGPLSVSVAPSFATKWLIHRLDSFRSVHPDINVRISASLDLVDLTAEGTDCAIRYGGGSYPGLVVDKLLTEAVFPVCSPALLAGPGDGPGDRTGGLDSPTALRRHTLLHDDSPDEDSSCPDWRMWLRAAGVGDVDAAQGPRFDQSSLVLEAAAAGQGVALAKARLADADLSSGRLVRPFGGVQHIQFAYYFVCAPGRASDPRVDAFRSWLKAECGRAQPPGETPGT